MMRLPEAYTQRMRGLLGAEYGSYLASLDREVYNGMRTNTLKSSPEALAEARGLDADRVPWCPEAFYTKAGDQASRHPYYYAGLYYLQEPSAMLPAATLPVQPGDRVLDLCAAPGGKSTQLLCRLQGKGLLVSNDISPSRAKALLKNLELFGGRNYVITTEAPHKLKERFGGFFTKILVDAPCSGEGMFHKEPQIVRNWEQYGNAYYAALQKEILEHAAAMLAPGGQLLYSTCTFAPMEDEQTIQDFLDAHPDFHLSWIPQQEGFDHGHPEWIEKGDPSLTNCVRLWPHRVRGEGHFAALLERDGDGPAPNISEQRTAVPEQIVSWCRENLKTPLEQILPEGASIRMQGEYAVAEILPQGYLKGLRVLRSGLLLGTVKKDRFEPSQAFAMALKMKDAAHVLDLPADGDTVMRYLKGETLSGDFRKDWFLVGVDGHPLGWGKGADTLLKNKYLKGWRYL